MSTRLAGSMGALALSTRNVSSLSAPSTGWSLPCQRSNGEGATSAGSRPERRGCELAPGPPAAWFVPTPPLSAAGVDGGMLDGGKTSASRSATSSSLLLPSLLERPNTITRGASLSVRPGALACLAFCVEGLEPNLCYPLGDLAKTRNRTYASVHTQTHSSARQSTMRAHAVAGASMAYISAPQARRREARLLQARQRARQWAARWVARQVPRAWWPWDADA